MIWRMKRNLYTWKHNQKGSPCLISSPIKMWVEIFIDAISCWLCFWIHVWAFVFALAFRVLLCRYIYFLMELSLFALYNHGWVRVSYCNFFGYITFLSCNLCLCPLGTLTVSCKKYILWFQVTLCFGNGVSIILFSLQILDKDYNFFSFWLILNY